jgi:hypothetical protein
MGVVESKYETSMYRYDEGRKDKLVCVQFSWNLCSVISCHMVANEENLTSYNCYSVQSMHVWV